MGSGNGLPDDNLYLLTSEGGERLGLYHETIASPVGLEVSESPNTDVEAPIAYPISSGPEYEQIDASGSGTTVVLPTDSAAKEYFTEGESFHTDVLTDHNVEVLNRNAAPVIANKSSMVRHLEEAGIPSLKAVDGRQCLKYILGEGGQEFTDSDRYVVVNTESEELEPKSSLSDVRSWLDSTGNRQGTDPYNFTVVADPEIESYVSINVVGEPVNAVRYTGGFDDQLAGSWYGERLSPVPEMDVFPFRKDVHARWFQNSVVEDNIEYIGIEENVHGLEADRMDSTELEILNDVVNYFKPARFTKTSPDTPVKQDDLVMNVEIAELEGKNMVTNVSMNLDPIADLSALRNGDKHSLTPIHTYKLMKEVSMGVRENDEDNDQLPVEKVADCAVGTRAEDFLNPFPDKNGDWSSIAKAALSKEGSSKKKKAEV